MEAKDALHQYLDQERSALLSRLDGLGEREIRWPTTPTGTNLLGLVKHVASIELGYFGEVFGRPSGIALPWLADDAEPNADLWATAEESRADVLGLYEQAAAHTAATVAALELDAPGEVPWWPEESRQVTLGQILVHMVAETAHHAGHADIVRELLDGHAGQGTGDLPELTAEQWAAYRRRLEQAADVAAR